MDKIMNELQKAFAQAEEEAIFKGIETNTIVLNEQYDYCKEFYRIIKLGTGYGNGDMEMKHYPPMIFGKKVLLGKIPKEYDCAFINQNVFLTQEETIAKLKKENEELREKLNTIKEMFDYD